MLADSFISRHTEALELPNLPEGIHEFKGHRIIAGHLVIPKPRKLRCVGPVKSA
jgi:hypothetical protein